MELVELITQAPWREAVTYRDTWPHEYVVIKKDKQQELLAAVCKRLCAGEGVDGKFFRMKNKYLFIGDYKYWLIPSCDEIDLDNIVSDEDDYILNRALLYRDRRDFLIRDGDNGRRDKELDWRFNISPSRYYTGDEVPVKQVWMNEAHDFTPWLAKNLSSLGDALGLKLELVQEEAAVGRYFVDILAEDTINGVLVVIENQLEWTDHDHLGKVLTYAGWHDSNTLIWVAPTFYEEHRSALDWLNRWTPEVIQVFGVEVHTTKVGDLDAAVEFVPVVFPTTWSKTDENRPSPAKIQSVALREFFQPLVDDWRNAGLTDKKKAASVRYHPFPSGVSGLTYYASLENDGKAWVYIPGGTANLDELRKVECRQRIENELDMSEDTRINWRVSGSGSLGVYRKGSLDDSEEDLEEIRKWMFEYLLKFKKVFNPRIEAIQGELNDADNQASNGDSA